MGELPAVERTKPAWAKWAIPLILIAIIVAAVAYDNLLRQRGDGARAPAVPATPRAAEQPAAAPAAPIPAPPAATASGSVPLANPLAGSDTAAAAGAGTAPAAMAPDVAAEPAGSTALVLTFRGASWTEVKDRTGASLLSQMNPAGQTQTLKGTPPFDLVIGNAASVILTYRGAPIDLAPYTQKGVARLSLE
jgi:cytoskeleton protein RodZ